MGVAGAGASSVASDASNSFHNPAGMTRIKGNELMGTVRRGRRRCRRPGPHHRWFLRPQPVG
jgi:long-subunit fatty acid transport protein